MSDSLFDLSGQVALVTGTSRGLGQYFARALARSGADIAMTSRDSSTLQDFSRELQSLGRKTFSTALDVRNHESIQQAVTAIEEHFGKIDILVNNAGCNIRKPALDVTWEDWNIILETNLRGSFFVAQAVARGMIARGYGRIINIASLSTFVALNEVAAYAASKAAVGSLTQTLAVEWSKHGVNVNAIAPGVFRTSLNANLLDSTPRGKEFLMRTPMGRFGNTDELIGAAVYLASDAASFVAGQIIAVDGGFLASGVNQ